MDERKLRRLKKVELLGIMLAQSRRIDELEKKVEEMERQLSEKRIKVENAGSLAEAAIQLTSIFEEAQKVADIYLTNLKNGNGGAYEMETD
ncbi:DNA repair protein [Streptococcus suis]|uniref:DNA repair protein n=2 Tax=Streptococcus TaxID=1301 RepID=A0A6L8MY83_STRSU|nr:DNA repair protein [Streptococcus parasuis]MYN70158.1 DNA repair protein [Streptococcus suis]MDG4478372.1 DNA repair protein [Streptococcus parasuis]NQK68322.1 DNA repair protein [Streptococcus suis]NQM30604.1 DNA repair protein [Streptococcus suis]NQM55943.1 DNA repair protein [Streptococcus suis]